MGPPRASRRSVVAISPGEEVGPSSEGFLEPSDEDETVRPQKHSAGKLKSVNKTKKAQQPTPAPSPEESSSQKSPGQTKSSRSKIKTTSTDRSKTSGKTIYSFFNTATQRQQFSQPSVSPGEQGTITHQDPEVIHDESGEDHDVSFSKDSSIALAMRKRKLHHIRGLEEVTSLAPAATQKFRKTSGGERTPSLTLANDDKRPWTEQFAPTDLSELAVHKRKVNDVRQWLDVALHGKRQRVLVLKGPAGTGKTSTVKLLARDMHFEVLEWKNPAGFEMAAEGSASTAVQFEDFLTRAGKAQRLVLSTDSMDDLHQQFAASRHGPKSHAEQVLLIEEFPNTFSRTSSSLQSFRSAIMQYVSASTVPNDTATPVVMIISESLLSTNTAAADSFTAHRLLGPELSTHPFVSMIEFNPVAPTILTKALETVVLKEARKSGRRKTPGPQVLKHLAETGDIRSAMSSLEFLCLRGDDGDTWSSKVTFTKSKKSKLEPALTKSEEDALKLITNRESSLGIFHSVGKVVYNKRFEPPDEDTTAHPPPWLSQHRRPRLPETDADSLMDELGTDTPTFIAALHENYALSCSTRSTEETLGGLSECSVNISDADLLCMERFTFGTRAFSGSVTETSRQDELSFQVAVRGMLFSLPHPVQRSSPAQAPRSDAHRMFYPTSLRLWKKCEEVECSLHVLTYKAQTGIINDLQELRHRKATASAGGVESWNQNHGLREQQKDDDAPGAIEAGRDTISVSKTEMLLDRLPFMAHLVHSSRREVVSPVLEQIRVVTQLHGSGQTNDTDEDGDDDGVALPEQWSTDKPDADSKKSEQVRDAGMRRKSRRIIEGGGLHLPIESGVDKLVLEDDDIVDD